MDILDVGLSDRQVPLDHLQGGMSQHLLQSVRIAAIAQILNGEGMPKAMDRDTPNAGPFPDPDQQFQQPVPPELPADIGQEHRLSFIGIRSGDQIAPERLVGAVAERDISLLGSLAKDLDPLVAFIQLVQLDRAQLFRSNAGIE